MGVWGTGIFQDDTACDIRDEYKQLLGDRLSAPEAKARILEVYKSSFADADDSNVAWLALAAVQWQVGRLDDDTLQRALAVIDSGANLVRWSADPKDRDRRKAALEKLRAQISSPQPAEKRIRKEVRCECHWKIGELISYQLLSGKLAIFRVISHHTDKGGTYPVCELLDWVGDEVPSTDALRALPIKMSRPQFGRSISKLMLVGLNKKWAKRVQEIGLTLEPAQTPERSSVEHFKYLDKFLKDLFSLE